MIYLKLFLVFLELGAVSFGGGYGMISLLREQVLAHGWMTEESFMNMLAVSESTPGPIAVNMATFVGSSQGGLFGSFCATLGVVLPAFIIMLVIVSLIRNFINLPPVQGALGGIRPCVVALICGTALIMGLRAVFGVSAGDFVLDFDLRALGIIAFVAAFAFACKRFAKKKPSPIILIVISAGLGILLY